MASAAQVRILPLSRDFFFAAACRPGHISCGASFCKCGERRERAVEACSDLPTWMDLFTFGSKFLVWKSQLFKYRVPQLHASTENSKPQNST
jgi:hypothetical protein